MIRTRRPEFVRYRELDRARINVDLQVHTTWTDGRASVEEMLDTATARGLGTVAITEHVRRDTDWFPGFAGHVRRAAKARPGVEVLVGCEAKALDTDGSLDASDELRAQCDLVLGSVHRFPDGHGGLLDFKALDHAKCAQMECELTLGLLRAAPIDILAHPAGMTQRRFGSFPASLFRRMLEASLERGIAVEINSSYLADVPGFLALCEEINPFVSVGSDAHRTEELGRCRDTLRSFPKFS